MNVPCWERPDPIALYRETAPVPLEHAAAQFRFLQGCYVVSELRTGGEVYLDVGESEDIGDRLASHDRKILWRIWQWLTPPQVGSTLLVRAIFSPLLSTADERRYVEGQLRASLRPVFGLR